MMEFVYPPSAWERTMKIQEVFGKVYTGALLWKEAAEILGVDSRTVRRWREAVDESGFGSLLDRRRRSPSPKRVAQSARNEVLKLYRETYRDWNVKHFHEALQARGVKLGYTWVKNLLQRAHLVQKTRKRDKHRKQRARKPMPGMMLHIDGSDHAWIPGVPGRQSLIAVMDDANNEVYYAKLVREESTWECLLALKNVVQTKGIFCTLYSDRAGHFFHTPKAKGKVDLSNLTQVGRALYELGIQMIPAYSPQARGRSERLNQTWQGRLPNELKLHGVKTIPDANRYILETFQGWYNKSLIVEPTAEGSAFTACVGRDLDLVFSVKEQRIVNCDNTVQWKKLMLQIEPSDHRVSFAKCQVTVSEDYEGRTTILYGPNIIGRYSRLGGNILNTTNNTKTKKRTNHLLPKADILTSY